jgi:hypothetical protein
MPRPQQESLVQSCPPSVVDAIRPELAATAGSTAGTVTVRASDLLVHGDGVITAGKAGPVSGELTAFCRLVLTAPAVVRRDGTVLAGTWLPELVRLGELEAHLGDGVIESAVDEAIARGG